MTPTLSCGHLPSLHCENTTGTAHLDDGREVCWACADTYQRECMATQPVLCAYLSHDSATVTTWSGGHLATVTKSSVRRVGFGRTARTYLSATDPTGRVWHGQSPGGGMYCTLRASKSQESAK